jgi:medium-chain acyl-[acyl-carrier-protein] hydrolase
VRPTPADDGRYRQLLDDTTIGRDRQSSDSGRIVLHCFPHAGGGVSTYRGWQESLPLDVQVRAFQLPGREERFDEPRLESFDAVMREVRSRLIPSLTGRYALFGHSLGAIVAFEVAREARRRGQALPVRLFVSGMQAPQTLKLERPFVHELPDPELVDMLETLGMPEEFRQDRELQSLFLPLLRSDFRIASTYQFTSEPPLACPISAWGGSEDPWAKAGPIDGWRAQTTADFRLRIVPGTHSFVHTSRDELLAGFVGDLAEARPSGVTVPC